MRIAVLSDIHSNIEALQAVLDHMGNVNQKWCLGDTIGYGPNPKECLDVIKSFDIVLSGNHEAARLHSSDRRRMNSVAAQAVGYGDLLDEDINFIEDLKNRRSLALGALKILVAHGSYAFDPLWGYVHHMFEARYELEAIEDADLILAGHTHQPMLCDLTTRHVVEPGKPEPLLQNVRYFLNPGSVGQPRDGDIRASYLILDINKDLDIAATFHRVEYDAQKTHDKIVAAGLDKRLGIRLLEGW